MTERYLIFFKNQSSPHLVLLLQSFEYDSIFNYEAAPEEKRFKSVYKYEELSNKNNYEADYYKVTTARLEMLMTSDLLVCLAYVQHHGPDPGGDPGHHVVDDQLLLHLPLPDLPPVLLVVRGETHRERPARHIPTGEDEGGGGPGDRGHLPLAGSVQESRHQSFGFQCSASTVHHSGNVGYSRAPLQ